LLLLFSVFENHYVVVLFSTFLFSTSMLFCKF
jgi:hypothetical protein